MSYYEDIRDKIGFPSPLYDFQDKEAAVRFETDRMVMKMKECFKVNCPDTVDKTHLELWTQNIGCVCITNKPDGVFRVFFGSLGAGMTPQYRPKKFIVADPWLNFNEELDIIWEKGQKGDCVVILNDALGMGLLPIHRKYATMIVENELSLSVADILARMPTILKADDENTRKSAEMFLENIIKGKLGIVRDTAFLDGLSEVQLTNQMHMLFHGLIEYEQYIYSRWLGELGLNSMFNLKREAISDAEKSMNEDELRPLIDDMKYQRDYAAELIRDTWGIEWSYEFNSSWADNMREIQLEQAIMEEEANGSDDDSDRSIDIREEQDSESGGSEENLSTESEGEGSEQSGTSEGNEEDSVDSGADETDNINIEVNINVNSDENKEPEKEQVEDENREDS